MSKEQREKSNILQKSRIISINSKLKKIEPNNDCKLIAIYGSNLGSNIGLRLSQQSLDDLYLTPLIQQILVGILLGDANIRIVGKNGKPHIQYNQGFIHLSYSLFINIELQSLCSHLPLLIRKKDGSFSLTLYTRCLNCLNPIYDNFIDNTYKTPKKKIPKNLEEYLTPYVLAI